MSLKTLPNGVVVRDETFGSHSRFCWNPDCLYLINIGRTVCIKCGWTAEGPLALAPVKPAPMLKARTRALEVIDQRFDKMNKTERKYADHLENEKRAGRIADWKWDALSIRIGKDCFWKPDFLVVDADGYVELHDTKAYWKSKGRAHIEDDARVKMVTIASAEFPVFTVVAVYEKDGVWERMVF